MSSTPASTLDWAGLDRVELTEVILVLAAVAFFLAIVALNRQIVVTSLRRNERAFRDLYENITEGVFRSTLDGRMISANPSLVRLNGFDGEAQMLREVNDIAANWYVDAKRRAEIHEMLLQSGRVTGLVSEVYRYRTRERIWIEENTRLVRDEKTGEPLYYDGTVREVTEMVRRAELQRRTDKIAAIISGCLYQHRRRPDGTSTMPYASQGIHNLFGVPAEAVEKDSAVLIQYIHPDDIDRIRDSLDHSAATLTNWQCEYRVVPPKGPEKWVFAHAVPEREADGSVLWHGFITDVSERKRSEAKIYDLAYFDPLTRLPNRSHFREHLDQAVVASVAGGRWGALLFIDLDQFKILNDTKGHHTGDRLLCAVADRLRGWRREGDTIARLGGDEFLVVQQDIDSDAATAKAKVAASGQELLSLIGTPYDFDGLPFHTSASIGAVLFRGLTETVEQVLMHADLAMYEAKAAGRGSLRFFETAMRAAAEEKLHLRNDLRDALDNGGLTLVYQPQVVDGGRCFAAEALLRWHHPARGEVEPVTFLPVAETAGLGDRIDEFVLKTAAATLKAWREMPATRDLELAVNISPHQLSNAGFVTMVADALARAGADPSKLTLELTEHVMLHDIAEVGRSMGKLKEMGVKFALDDFGTGYSSLTYLKRLPIDTLKIDRSFISDLEANRNDRAIVQTILNIAESLEVKVVAEGVETELQVAILHDLGCRAYQGYFYGRPMRHEAFLAFLAPPDLSGSAPAMA